MLADSLTLCPERDRDFVKAWAVATNTLERLEHPVRKGKLERLLKKAEAKLSPEELRVAQVLAEEGYPTAEKFRREAFEIIKEYGDLPPEAVFEE
jgi:glycerol dehydrogenase-like iron-containing ADH family enzyme